MAVSLLSVQFLAFWSVVVTAVTVLAGLLRTALFLAANIGFVYWVLGLSGLLSTLAFCGLGWLLVLLHRRFRGLRLIHTLPLFVLLFAYMRNYEFLGLVVPASAMFPVLQTIGLSFILFRIIHLLVDVRGGALGPITLPDYLNYTLAFTTFMMGPIQRFQDFRAQWTGERLAIPLTFEAHLDAVLRILVGLVKVYVLGTALHPYTLAPGVDVTTMGALDLMWACYAFYFFLYFNFSGYCDVVIGIGSLMGVRPPENFNKPFIAQNIADFWQRQHRSLTEWLTSYVFTPAYKQALSRPAMAGRRLLAGNLSIALTMLVSGLWHGTTISFLIFGLLHGIYLIVYHSWDHVLLERLGRKRVRDMRSSWPGRLAGIAITFNAAAFAFLFFQLDTQQSMTLLENLVSR